MKIKLIESLSEIDNSAWNRIAGNSYPFLRHEFLSALEQSGSVCPETGWEQKHLLIYDNKKFIAAMPMYLKSHSRGEFVFDYQWADVFRQYGLTYYPKLITGIPFIPCSGPRIIVNPACSLSSIITQIVDYLGNEMRVNDLSSWHCLFPDLPQMQLLKQANASIRLGVQYHWHNRSYRDFNDFLATFKSSKRKQIKKERRQIKECGIEFKRIPGQEISSSQWNIFYQMYRKTYYKFGMTPYLNLDFFQQLSETMPEQIVLILALVNNKTIAGAFNMIGSETLYGRYWGCNEQYKFLHFETCYYQGLEYCIDHGILHFDSGAQGEHKIARGFEPMYTYSAHIIRNASMASMIDRYLKVEGHAVKLYKQKAEAYLPFKN